MFKGLNNKIKNFSIKMETRKKNQVDKSRTERYNNWVKY